MRNFKRLLFASVLALAGCVGQYSSVAAAEWPKEKPITAVFPYAAGADYLARLVASELEKTLGQTVVVDNKPGAGGATGTGFAARQAPDGYTIVFAFPGPAANYLNTYKSLPYHPIEDFEHITQVSVGDMVLVARKDLPVSTLEELIAYGKANPGKLSAGNNGIGTYGHMIELALADKTGIEIKLVPYKGSAPILTDMLSGSLDLSIDYVSDANLKQIEAGAIKPIAVVSPKRTETLPNTPTFQEAGIDIVAAPWIGIMAPKGTPPEIVDKLNSAIAGYLSSADAKAKFAAIGQTAAPTTPEGFRQIVVNEERMWRDLIKKYNIQAN